jgi:outer membrane protein insertion porin family
MACTLSLAIEPFVIKEIRVEGLQRVEPGTVFASIPLRVNETFNDEKGSPSARCLAWACSRTCDSKLKARS